MKTVYKTLKYLLVLLIVLVAVYALGPKVKVPVISKKLPKVTSNLIALEHQIKKKENNVSNIRPNNQSRIIWYDSVPSKTKYCILYLHGWSASSEEGAPIHSLLGERYGANVYLPRLAGHGLNEKNAMLNLSATDFINSAKEALAVAKQLGEKVIIMGTSTGGTLALYFAGGDKDIAALLLYSPNVEIYDSTAKFLSWPWGEQIIKTVYDGDFYEYEADSLKQNYWTTKYRLEALLQLQVLLDVTMTEDVFKSVIQPTFIGYYYKDEEHQDRVISVPALLKMYDELGTTNTRKRKVAFPDVGSHVMTSYITSKDLKSVEKETYNFIEEVLFLQPIE